MERNRQKLVGRDKGSLTEQQNKGHSNDNDTDKENIQIKIIERRTFTTHGAPEPGESSCCPAPPSQNPA